MGLVESLLDFFRPYDVLDEKTGLTTKQKRMIQNTWRMASKNTAACGVAIMIRFFEKYPQYQDEFQPFRGIPLTELASSKKFQAHCAGIVTTLSSAIDSLDDAELMGAVLNVTGERHGKRGQKFQAFKDLKPIIMEVLESSLEHEFTPEVAQVWDQTLDLMFAHISHGMQFKHCQNH